MIKNYGLQLCFSTEGQSTFLWTPGYSKKIMRKKKIYTNVRTQHKAKGPQEENKVRRKPVREILP